MDPAKEGPFRSAVELQGAMLGKHEEELCASRHAVESLTAQVSDLSAQLHLCHESSSQNRLHSSEPRINNPPCYAGEPTECRAFLTQCEVFFSLQPQTYAADRARIAYVVSLLTGRARGWATAAWEAQASCCGHYELFKGEMIKVFDRSVYGREASRLLAVLHQGERSVADFAIEFHLFFPHRQRLVPPFLLFFDGPVSPFPVRRSSTRDKGIILSWKLACHINCLVSAVSSVSVFQDEPSDLSGVPEEYLDLRAVFSRSRATSLPPHRPYDCSIDLLPGTMPPRGRLYSLSAPEREALEKYLTESLAAEIIVPSSSPAGAGFFFVKKRDGSLCPCIDYQGLNDITVKNRYPLPLMSSAFEILQGAKIFTKLDLRNA